MTNVIEIDSIQNLKQTDINEDAVEVLGYYNPGDGGGGLFYWDSNSTEADNGGTIIKPTYSGFGGTGRWKRPDQQQANVKFFGIGFSSNFDEEETFYEIINNFDDVFIPENTTVKLGTDNFKSTNVQGEKNYTWSRYNLCN